MMTLNHGLSGYVCGQVAMPLLRRRSPVAPRALGWAFFLGAMLPDGDIAVRLLAGRGAYFSSAWYGHRGASHSLLGTLVLGLLCAAVLQRLLVPREHERPRQAYAWLAGCAWAGGIIHLFGDLFTPGWQLPLFWPLAERFGAWRHIGWFSPYLLWLFLAAIALAQLAHWALGRREGLRGWAPALAWGLYALAGARWVSFLVSSRYEGWEQWMALQQQLLPEVLVTPLTQGVGAVWHWFTG
jgi:membrane-bound metal-dependent hydrolase YbcI (DUF457 family)